MDHDLCESPHDNLPKWAAVLTAYFDESMESGDGVVVVAGFIGNRSAWVSCVRKWRRVLKSYGRQSIHLKELRFQGNRHKAMLADLGAIPDNCGLRLLFGCVDVRSYKSLVGGKIIEVNATGYLFAYQKALISAMRSVPKGQRLEVICEQQHIYAVRKDNMNSAAAMIPRYIDKHGKSVLAKWSSIPKSTILEPSDYAAFALLQRLIDPKSKKAIFCTPILTTKRMRGSLPGPRDREILESLMKSNPSFMNTPLSSDERKAYLKQLPTGEDFKKSLAEMLREHPSLRE